MKQNKFGEIVFNEADLLHLLMQDPGRSLDGALVDQTVNLSTLSDLDHAPDLVKYATDETQTIEQFDQHQQQNWHMPSKYKTLDIAQHILDLCKTDAELQRCGAELLLFQERNLFDLLRYLHYLVQVMREHKIVWGVGRGSSVASYVLYLLGVHRVNSMYYNLDPREFLR